MPHFIDEPTLSLAYAQAFQFAFEQHFYQIRKKGKAPYIAHLMATSSLVLEAGGDETEAIAALLHDSVEDVGVELLEIRRRFGTEVAIIVATVTEDKNLPFNERKSGYIQQVANGSDAVVLVSCADKLHNLRDYFTTGRSLWKPETQWFYRELMKVYEECDRIPRHWLSEMKKMLDALAY